MLAMNGDYWYRRNRDLPKRVTKDFWPTVDRFLERGAEYNLSIAAMKCDEPRARALLRESPEDGTQLDAARVSYLYYCACSRAIDIAELLIKHGANPSAPERLSPNGRALHEACNKAHVTMVRLLLAHGADPNAEVDSSGDCLGIVTAFEREGKNRTQVLKLLRDHGATPASYGMTVGELREAMTPGD